MRVSSCCLVSSECGRRRGCPDFARHPGIAQRYPGSSVFAFRPMHERHWMTRRSSVEKRLAGMTGWRFIRTCLRREVLADALPALVIVLLQLRRLQRLPRGADHLARLEHEGHGAADHVGLREIRVRGLLERGRVRAVTAHAKI